MEVGQATGHGLCYVTQLSPGHGVTLQVVCQWALLAHKNAPKVTGGGFTPTQEFLIHFSQAPLRISLQNVSRKTVTSQKKTDFWSQGEAGIGTGRNGECTIQNLRNKHSRGSNECKDAKETTQTRFAGAAARSKIIEE